MKVAIGIAIIVILYLGFFLTLAEDASDRLYYILMPVFVAAFVASLGGFILFMSWLFS